MKTAFLLLSITAAVGYYSTQPDLSPPEVRAPAPAPAIPPAAAAMSGPGWAAQNPVPYGLPAQFRIQFDEGARHADVTVRYTGRMGSTEELHSWQIPFDPAKVGTPDEFVTLVLHITRPGCGFWYVRFKGRDVHFGENSGIGGFDASNPIAPAIAPGPVFRNILVN